MFLQLRTFALGLTLVTVLGLSRPAAAEKTIPARGSADGQVIFQIDPTPENPVGVQVWSVTGRGTVLGKHNNQGVTLFTADGNVTGIFVVTAADGSTVSGSYSGYFAPIPDTSDFMFEVETVWESGTGRMEGVSGGATVVAILNGLTGALRYDYTGVWILP